jgi:hypothetical protein
MGGAMGLNVWLLLAHHADWRWMETTDKSPWYPTLRLFRQPQREQWPSLFAAIANELQSFIQARQEL